ncbi:MAG: cytochrome c4 [Woeseia sp.]|nr:cytochrome c4 [Woeseia sp.]
MLINYGLTKDNGKNRSLISNPRLKIATKMSHLKIKFTIMKNAIVAYATLLLSGAAFADGLVEGNSEAGKAKSITCSACHGPDGNSINPVWPSIAGQHAKYMVEQLKAFKSGARNEPLMLGQVMLLNESDMANLSVYYSGMQPTEKTVANPETIEHGQRIYRGGNRETGASACIACHGPTGIGNPAASVPSISGQYAVYLAAQLRAYATGARQSDGPTRVMRDIASRLSEDDILAVSSYMQGLN